MNIVEPKWKEYIPGKGSSHVFLPLRDMLDLRFICDVLVDFFTENVADFTPDLDKVLPSIINI
jgi:hypothetical protein